MFIENCKSLLGQAISWENTFQPDKTSKTIILYYKLSAVGTNSQIPLLHKLIFK